MLRNVQIEYKPVVPPVELFAQAAQMDIELQPHEVAALSGLIQGTPCEDKQDEMLRGDIILAPYRSYEDPASQQAVRDLALYGLFQAVKASKKQTISLDTKVRT